MSPRLRALVVAALVGAAAPVVLGGSPAGAVDQDLVVSAVAGAPGAGIAVSSASCVDELDAEVLRYLSVRLISGTAPDEVLAGFGTNDGPTGVTIVIPDWVDADQPAVIEATCQELDFSTVDLAFSETAYDPVAFDVEPGAGPPAQAAVLSRTELLVGQGFAVDATGCTLPGAAFGLVEVAAGDDRSGRSIAEVVTSGGEEMLGGTEAFHAEPLFVDGSAGWSASKLGDEPAVIDEVREFPNEIPPGTYTALPYCTDAAGAYLAFEPELVEVTGTAPIADIDLVADDAARRVEMAGGSCTSGDVQASLTGEDIEAAFAESSGAGDESITTTPLPAEARSASALGSGFAPEVLPEPDAAPDAGTATGERSIASVLAEPDGTSRALAVDGYLDEVVTPDASGAWALADTVGFDVGVVYGYALCGDPLGDGWFYDPQIVAVQSAQEPAPLEPQPTGAVPIRADPAYTG